MSNRTPDARLSTLESESMSCPARAPPRPASYLAPTQSRILAHWRLIDGHDEDAELESKRGASVVRIGVLLDLLLGRAKLDNIFDCSYKYSKLVRAACQNRRQTYHPEPEYTFEKTRSCYPELSPPFQIPPSNFLGSSFNAGEGVGVQAQLKHRPASHLTPSCNLEPIGTTGPSMDGGQGEKQGLSGLLDAQHWKRHGL